MFSRSRRSSASRFRLPTTGPWTCGPKVREYLAFGVAYVWIVDPITGTGEIHSPEGTERVENGRFRAGEIEVQLGDL
jgi:hypothetical protein